MKYFNGPVAIVLEADMLRVSIFVPHELRARLRWKPDLGVPKSIVPICIYLRPYFARAERDTGGRSSPRATIIKYFPIYIYHAAARAP